MPERASPGTPLVLMHGDFGNGHDTWGQLAAEIGDRYRTVILDRPGFDGEAADQERFTIAGDAQHALHALDGLGIGSFHLAGHSYGGIVAIEMTRRRPVAVRSLHLIEPPLLKFLPQDPKVEAMDQEVRQLQADHDRVGADATTASFFTMIGAAHVVERLQGTPEWARLRGYADRFARNEPPGDYSLERLDMLPARLPIVVYSGGRSHPALRAIAVALAQRPDVARLVDVPSAGHAVQMAGAPFIDPLLNVVADVDAAWGTPTSGSCGGSA